MLYNEGLYLLNNKQDYKEAAKKFDEVDRENPYSDWARKALLMSAYAYYQARRLRRSASTRRNATSTLHPGSPDAAYAQYLIGASYYDQILDVSRDQARADKAIDALQEVVRKYPNSEYAIRAQKKIDMARDQLAGKEMDIGRYYMKSRDFIGAINRFKVVVTQYQTTRHVEEALERLSEAYVALGIIDEAQTAAAVLGHNFPDSPWYKDAYNLVKNMPAGAEREQGVLDQPRLLANAHCTWPGHLRQRHRRRSHLRRCPCANGTRARAPAPGAPISGVPPPADKG